MAKPTIIAYLKPHCGWSNGVRAIFEKYNLKYQERNIIDNPGYYREMYEKSGQNLSPCVVINGGMLADVSGDEVEEYMIKNKIVEKIDKHTDVPTDSPCIDEADEAKDLTD